MTSAASDPSVPRPAAPAEVRWIARTLEEAGFETWAVGGAVRDTILGIPSGDWDLATRARPGEVRRVFRRTVPIGIDHGTVGVLARSGVLYEVTTFRRDIETSGRHAVVEFADEIDEDLARRDFTINAVAWHPLREELRDPFGGASDLVERRLRTVGTPAERFAEDHLRVLRGLRFAGRFGMRIVPETWDALREAVPLLTRLSSERVREELMKVLGGDPRPSGALALFRIAGVVDLLFPEMEGAFDARGIGRLLAADALPRSRPLVRLASLLRSAGPDGAAALLLRLRGSNADIDRVAGMVRGVGEPLPAEEAEGAELRRWLRTVGHDFVYDVLRLHIAEARVSAFRGLATSQRAFAERVRALRREAQARPPLTEGALDFSGRDLIGMGLKPGPRFGEILSHLLDRVVDDPGLNQHEILSKMAREYLDRGKDPEEAGGHPAGEPR